MIGFSNDVINIIQSILVTVVLFLAYTYWGNGFCNIVGFKCNLSLKPIIGFVVDYFIYIIIELPCCIFDMSFKICTWGHLLIMFIITIIIYKLKATDIMKEIKVAGYKEIVFISSIVMFMVLWTNLISYYPYFSDDPWNCNNVCTILSTNRLYRHDPESGQYVGFNNVELLFYVYFPYMASMCKYFFIKPIIVFYKVFLTLEISMYFLIVYSFIKVIFEDKEKQHMAFVLFLVFTIVFSREGNSSYTAIMATPMSQGVICTIWSPLIAYMLIRGVKDKEKNYWLLFAIVLFDSVFVNRTAGIATMIIMATSFVPYAYLEFKRKECINVIKYIFCCLPALISIIVTIL